MTDRELLELAAKAVGLNVRWHEDSIIYGPTMEIMECESGGPPWNPLNEDGDALRLAALLKIEIEFSKTGRRVYAGQTGDAKHMEEYTPDCHVNAATRRAIVRAAAEIGKGMK